MHRTLIPSLIVPLLLTAACASAADDAGVEAGAAPDAAAALHAVPDAAVDAGTAAFEMVLDVDIAGQPFTMQGSGAFDRASDRLRMEMDMGAMFEDLAIVSDGHLPAGFDEPVQIVADGSTMYLRAPLFDLIGGGGWVSLAAADLGATGDGGLDLGSYDPVQLLEALRGVAGEPEVVGTEPVRGVETTRYSATADVAQALEAVPEEQRARLEAQLDQLGDTTIPIDVWVDGDGLPRRVRVDMAASYAAKGLDDARAVLTVELFDYGQPVGDRRAGRRRGHPPRRRRRRSGRRRGRLVIERTVEIDGHGGPVRLALAEAGERRTAAAPRPRVHRGQGGLHRLARSPRRARVARRRPRPARARRERTAPGGVGLLLRGPRPPTSSASSMPWAGIAARSWVTRWAGWSCRSPCSGLRSGSTASCSWTPRTAACAADPGLVELGVAIARTEGMAALMAAQDALGRRRSARHHRHTRGCWPAARAIESSARASCWPRPRPCTSRCSTAITDPAGVDRLDALASVTVPTLVLVGEQDTPFLKPSHRMAEAIPGAELAVLPDGGHSPQFETPDHWWKALSTFLERV